MTSFFSGTVIGNLGGVGPLSQNLVGTVATSQFDTLFVRVLSNIIGVMTAIGALWFVFQLFTGALAWISAGSDKQALDNAKKKFTNGLLGLGIVVASYAIIGVVGYFFGIDIIRLQNLILQISVVQP